MSPVSSTPATELRRSTPLRSKPPDPEADPDAHAELERWASRGQGESAGNSGGTRGTAVKDDPKESDQPVGVGVAAAPGVVEVDDGATAINFVICLEEMQVREEAVEQSEEGEGSAMKRVSRPRTKRRPRTPYAGCAAPITNLIQDFSMRYPLVQGHGNFGSIDADPPAAMRYTECRLDPLTEAMFLTDLELNTVDYVLNFHNSQKEPSMSPARVSSLLLSESSGIAVGIATNIPPHNLGELVDALSVIIQNPEATLQELLECMPGPDFPTGGIIMENDGILDAYRTGRGRVVVRGKTDMETIDKKSNRTAIIIKEIPYQQNISTLVQRIAELVEDKVLEGISDIRDESDHSGMRVVIEVKRGVNPAIVLNNLYRHTTLQSSFSCNIVAILNGHPKLMGLKEILQAFLDFRCSVIEKRAEFKLSQALERNHIVEGIVIGLDNLDSVIQIIRETSNHTLAKESLAKEYGLSEKQAEALLDITLRKLTSVERKKFIDEANSLSEGISKLNELLSSKKLMFQLIYEDQTQRLKEKELKEAKKRQLLGDNFLDLLYSMKEIAATSTWDDTKALFDDTQGYRDVSGDTYARELFEEHIVCLKERFNEKERMRDHQKEKIYNRKPCILEDQTGECQYQNVLETSQSTTQYKQLTLEEAEEKMKRTSNKNGCERGMRKSATHGAAAFGSDLKNLHHDVNGNSHKRYAETDTSVDSVQGKEISCSKFDVTQVFVNLFGTCISLQKNLNLLTAELLVEAACEKAGMKSTDSYSTFCGKILDPQHPLSFYEIHKDSTIKVTHRVRGGGWPQPTETNTWEDIIKGKPLYHTVNLPADLLSSLAKTTSATYLEDYFKYHSRLVVIGMSRKHFIGLSYGGKFDPKHLLFKNGEFQFDDILVPDQYSHSSGLHDFDRVAQIFHEAFYEAASKTYPLYLDHLLTFLRTPPSQTEPNSESVVALLTSHFSLLSYTERVAITEILHRLIMRLSWDSRNKIASCGLKVYIWISRIDKVPEMNKVYLYDSYIDKQGRLRVPYNSSGLSCLQFSDNYFKHAGCYAGSSISLEMIEASLSLLMDKQNFVPTLIQTILITLVKKFQPLPAELQQFVNDVLALLGNNLIGCEKK